MVGYMLSRPEAVIVVNFARLKAGAKEISRLLTLAKIVNGGA